MSSDRELLEKAAKAAGLVAHDVSSRGLWVYPVESELNWDGEYPIFDWNPLEGDGDALRLAVKLRLCLFLEIPRIGIGPMLNGPEVYLDEDDDEMAAVRRAIVRAAAALADATPSSDGRKA